MNNLDMDNIRGKNIVVPNITVAHPNNILLDNTDLKIVFGRKYALIGNNGTGKSSLLKYICDNKDKFPDITIMSVEQEAQQSEKNVFDEVISVNTERLHLFDLLEKEQDLLKLEEISNKLDDMDAYNHESIVRRILYGLGFDSLLQDRPVSTFSGGFRMRISLAKALYLQPDVLLLDEPNNHLDLNSIIWLTNYLVLWKKTLLIVSHDKNFINEICTDTIHLESKKLYYYKGNYDKYLQGVKLRDLERDKKWKNVQRVIKEMRNKHMVKNEIDKYILKNECLRPLKPYKINLNFGTPSLLNSIIVNITNLSIGYSTPIVSNINLEIGLNTKYVLVGKNGAGKTTLFKTIMKKINPISGTCEVNGRARIGYYNQHATDVLPGLLTPCEYIQSLDKTLDIQLIRKYLGIIGLEGKLHNNKIETLSGGQKSRVLFVSVFVMKPHLLLLDEPTNHLDMATIDGLIKSINSYEGSIIVSTHNIELINSIKMSVLEICDDTLKVNVNFEDYCARILEQVEKV